MSALPPPVAWTSTGKYSLNQIAQSHGMSAHQLIQSTLASQTNPGLTSYLIKGNWNLQVPSGVQFLIPASNWRS